MTNRKTLRKRLWSDRHLDEQNRDLREVFDLIPDVEVRSFDGAYQTGMTLRLADGSNPIGIELIRAYNPKTPEVPVTHGTACSFRLKEGGAEITRIDGLSTSGTQLRMVFRITYGD